MALSIKNPESERLARELARITGESARAVDKPLLFVDGDFSRTDVAAEPY